MLHFLCKSQLHLSFGSPEATPTNSGSVSRSFHRSLSLFPLPLYCLLHWSSTKRSLQPHQSIDIPACNCTVNTRQLPKILLHHCSNTSECFLLSDSQDFTICCIVKIVTSHRAGIIIWLSPHAECTDTYSKQNVLKINSSKNDHRINMYIKNMFS